MTAKLLISGGGTGGHVSPGLGVAREWQQRHGEGSVTWVGRPEGIERSMAEKAGLPYRSVTSAALRRSVSPRNLALPWALARGLRQALQVLRIEAPVAVLLTGGYVGLPLGIAAAWARTPLILLEPNAVPGLANRLLKPWAQRLCRAYPDGSAAPGLRERDVLRADREGPDHAHRTAGPAGDLPRSVRERRSGQE